MKLEFYNCPKPEEMPGKNNLSPTLPLKGEGGAALLEKPEFVKYVPDLQKINKIASEHAQYQNILIIGHGGSVNPFYGLYEALKYQAKKQVFILNTVDPDYIFELKQKLQPENTLVIPISKSGETVTLMEALAQFLNYPLLFITGKSSPLRAIAEKIKAPTVFHPPIGGRYTGLTEVALLPLAIAGIGAEDVYQGAKNFYQLYEKDNLAWRAASTFWQLEQQGYVDVFMPFYSHNLFPFSNIIVQLCHESFGKAKKGQTYFAHEAPESQHHTNQRFFGGQKNIAGFFVGSNTFLHQASADYPPSLHSVQLKSHALFDISKIPLEKSMEFELQGTMEDARINGIPLAHLSISGFSSSEIGGLMAFWQLYAVYSSALRKVDPFDQPQVENSKKISFTKRLAFKGLL
ncbi:MAG: hypothetical protein M1383_04375 [Patescibacteria group bacterium]|nr:hypothetical protein [Patescibacteria group bacterium]